MELDKDPRVLALREVATDECEYSGWVDLAQGALDVIEELRQKLALTEPGPAPAYEAVLGVDEQWRHAVAAHTARKRS